MTGRLILYISAGALAKCINVPRTRIERLAAESSPVTPDTALRLGKVFATSPEIWMNLQTAFDLTARSRAMKEEIAGIEEMRAA
jgi:antitoxin HigA-1